MSFEKQIANYFDKNSNLSISSNNLIFSNFEEERTFFNSNLSSREEFSFNGFKKYLKVIG